MLGLVQHQELLPPSHIGMGAFVAEGRVRELTRCCHKGASQSERFERASGSDQRRSSVGVHDLVHAELTRERLGLANGQWPQRSSNPLGRHHRFDRRRCSGNNSNDRAGRVVAWWGVRALHPGELQLSELTKHTRGLADLATETNLATPVPTCGTWNLADLLWHLYEVQHFWLHIVTKRPEGPESYTRPERPDDRLLTNPLRATAKLLVQALEDADPADTAWTWHASDQTIGFAIRRQIHEALIHHYDGLIAVGEVAPRVNPRLAADGVDEMVDVMLSSTTTAGVVELHATDTEDRWTLAPKPRRDDGTADLVIEGTALNLLLWLWGREIASSLTMTGDLGLADQLRLLIISATE